ncbi:uncharacterized protein LOC129615164 [Condylostylus longicornis]|uniref:uncharacterized protein LOC129615164 n=1 Tax=Condylostylus longicornis TaxID=2530218 RepID=UPI00244DE9DE|nr:uncharacterized protein LOC129615164 [Condylostylus longicornis]XP_055386235.1 uncharacterized protein LOC129615164 [Condylostylus longicornis]
MRLGKIDPNSYSEPEKVVLKHVEIQWVVDFEKRCLIGDVLYEFKVHAPNVTSILLDVKDITIVSVHHCQFESKTDAEFCVGDCVEGIGSKLEIKLPQKSKGV